MSEYVVLTCVNALDLFIWGNAEYKVWVLLDDKGSCAMNGYAFVPPDRWPEMRRRCPSQFRVKPLDYDLLQRPKTISVLDMVAMQEALEGGPPAWTPEYGIVVQVKCGIWKNMLGTVVKVKDHTARILLGTAYVSVPIAFLNKV